MFGAFDELALLSSKLLCMCEACKSKFCSDNVSDVASSKLSKLLPSNEMSELQKLSFELPK